MSDNLETDEKSVRVNVRIPRKQYELMKKFGAVLGLETDGGCVKHFITLGLQASASGISSIQVVENNTEAVRQLQRMNDSVERVEQLDLVKQAETGRTN